MAKKILKRVSLVIAGLVGLLLVAGVVLFLIGTIKLGKKYTIQVTPVTIPTDAESIQRGEHLATIFMCTDCHMGNMGGQIYFEVPGMVSIPTPNLTTGEGGIGADLTNEDWVRAVRHGVGSDGSPLFIMPSSAYNNISDQDLGLIIAYIKNLPLVDNLLPERRVDPLGRVMMAVGMFPPLAADRIDHSITSVATLPSGVTVAYGEYLTHVCRDCHGDNFNGAPFGPPGQEVFTPNLTLGGELRGWTEQDFVQALRTGVTPGGHQLSEEMPWKYFGQMTDEELSAVWAFLHSLPAMEQAK